MTATWTTIPNSDLDSNSPLNTTFMTAIRDNLEALAAAPMYLRFDEQVKTPGVAGTFEQFGGTVNTMLVKVPPFGKGLSIPLQVKTASGTATFECRVVTTAEISAQVTTTSAAYERKVITFSDLSALRGTYIQIQVWGKSTVPASTGVKGELGAVCHWDFA